MSLIKQQKIPPIGGLQIPAEVEDVKIPEGGRIMHEYLHCRIYYGRLLLHET